MKKDQIIFKYRLQAQGLYELFFKRLLEIKKPYSETIKWKNVYIKIGRSFSIQKQQVREIIFFLAEMNFLEVNNKGVKILFEIKNGS